MQTFLPYVSFEKSAKCLDRQRLGKQRVEVLQILKTLHGESKGWRNHPAVRMWSQFNNALVYYGLVCCDEWIRRGYADTCRSKIAAYRQDCKSFKIPSWLTVEFCIAHQSNLIRKDEAHYRQFFPTIPADLNYIWPV